VQADREKRSQEGLSDQPKGQRPMRSLASLRATLHFILQYIAPCRDVSFPLALTPPHLPFGTPLNLIAIVCHLVCNQMFLTMQPNVFVCLKFFCSVSTAMLTSELIVTRLAEAPAGLRTCP